MSFYKQPCRFCGTLIGRDGNFCPKCGSNAPFSDRCPACKTEIHRDEQCCSCCGRNLYVICPHCKERTFVTERCDHCGKSLMKQCENPRCMELQFFQNRKCTACGKRFK